MPIADEEGERGVMAIAVPVLDPVNGKALGTTSIAGPVSRLSKEHHVKIADALSDAARQLGKIWPLRPAAQKSNAG